MYSTVLAAASHFSARLLFIFGIISILYSYASFVNIYLLNLSLVQAIVYKYYQN